MPLIRNARFVEDAFMRVTADEPLPEGPVIVPLARFLAAPEALLARDAPLGVRISSEFSPEALGPHVHRLELIELEFPKFKDGRAYSWARLLRTRLNYRGQIRAVGEVLRDQWLFMHRVGIDAFEVRPQVRIEDFRLALREQTVFYQPSAAPARGVLTLRHAGRAPALAAAE